MNINPDLYLALVCLFGLAMLGLDQWLLNRKRGEK